MCFWVFVETTYAHQTETRACRKKGDLQAALGIEPIPVAPDQWDPRHGEWWSPSCCLCNCDLAATALQAGMTAEQLEADQGMVGPWFLAAGDYVLRPANQGALL